MTTKINGRTSEEIKKGLECCIVEYKICDECPFADVYLCEEKLRDCAIILIKQLQEDKKQLERERDELLQKNQQLERERNAAVEELKVYKFCTACKHDKDDLDVNKSSPCYGCHSKSNWEWRGPQEVDN